jgi:hypothetical protein
MFKTGDIVKATFYKDTNFEDENWNDRETYKMDVIVFSSEEKTFRCFSDDDINLYYCFYDIDESGFNCKVGELTKEDYDIKLNAFSERRNKWEMERMQKFLDTEKEIEWNEDPLNYPFLYESSVNAQSHNSYFSEAVGIVTLKGDVFPYLRRFWTSEPLNESSPKVIPESIEAGKPSKRFAEKEI